MCSPSQRRGYSPPLFMSLWRGKGSSSRSWNSKPGRRPSAARRARVRSLVFRERYRRRRVRLPIRRHAYSAGKLMNARPTAGVDETDRPGHSPQPGRYPRPRLGDGPGFARPNVVYREGVALQGGPEVSGRAIHRRPATETIPPIRGEFRVPLSFGRSQQAANAQQLSRGTLHAWTQRTPSARAAGP
jgi:hypothetical protein